MSRDATEQRRRRLTGVSSRRVLLRTGVETLLLAAAGASRWQGVAAQVLGRVSGTAPAYASTLQLQLEQLVGDLLVPSAAVMVRSPDLGDWTATFGTRRLGGTQPVTAGDHVRIGSNTKPMTGTVILQLVEEGALRLDDPVASYRPDVPNGDQITITDLLDMRGGLYDYPDSLELGRALDTDPGHVYSPEELLAIAFAQPPYFAPGSGYHYSNTSYILLGVILEQLTGESASAAFQRRIFNPLGLTETVLPPLDSAAIADPHPQGYMYGTNAEAVESEALSTQRQVQAAAGTLRPADVTDVSPSWAWTAGSGISTADELVQFVQVLVGGGLLSSQMQAQRLASMLPTNPSRPTGTQYGLGLAKFGPLFGHTGEIPGYSSFMGYDPNQDITVVTWTSLSFAPDGRAPATEMALAIMAQLYDAPSNTQAPSQ